MAQDDLGIVTLRTVGMLEFGTALSMLLMGIETLQVWNYFRKFGDDGPRLKLLVTGAYFLDILHCSFLLHTTYIYTMAAIDANPVSLKLMTWSLKTSIPLTGVMAFLVEGFYCLRVWRLTRNKPVTAVCGFLTVSRAAVTVGTSTTIFRTGTWGVVELHRFRVELGTQLSIGAAADIVIAIAICTALVRMRSGSGFESTNRLIDGIVAFTIGSGLATSVVSLAECIVYIGFNNIGFLVPYAITSNVFNNSLLAALNGRKPSELRATRSAEKTGIDTVTGLQLASVESV